MKLSKIFLGIISTLVILFLIYFLFFGSFSFSFTPDSKNDTKTVKDEVSSTITLATTTSTNDSGLLDYILPEFKKKYNIDVKVVPLGTGAALEYGKNGDADVLLVHAKEKEIAFVEEGYGVERFDVMYNDFVIVGPKDDPANVKNTFPSDPINALKLINDSGNKFVSRNDESGTNVKELSLLKSGNITFNSENYILAGQGMAQVLQMSSELEAYTLTDRATFVALRDELELDIVCEKNDLLFNEYGVIMVNPEKYEINKDGAQKFIDWILSKDTQKLIGKFGIDEYNESLFTPNAK